MGIGTTLVVVLLGIGVPATCFAQDWIDYENREDHFAVNFPGQPTIRETTYQPQRGKPLPARVYSVENARGRFTVTVVDYRGFRESSDVLGSIAWAAWNYRKKGGEITYDAFAAVDRIPGHQLHITNPDKTQTSVGIHLHKERLYILESRVPAGDPSGTILHQSLSILDDEGKRIRYEVDMDGQILKRVR